MKTLRHKEIKGFSQVIHLGSGKPVMSGSWVWVCWVYPAHCPLRRTFRIHRHGPGLWFPELDSLGWMHSLAPRCLEQTVAPGLFQEGVIPWSPNVLAIFWRPGNGVLWEHTGGASFGILHVTCSSVNPGSSPRLSPMMGSHFLLFRCYNLILKLPQENPNGIPVRFWMHTDRSLLYHLSFPGRIAFYSF